MSKPKPFHLILFALTIIGVGWLFYTGAFTGGGFQSAPAAPAPKQPTDFDAYFMCQEFMRERLKAPSTAEFVSFNDKAVTSVQGLGNSQYRVTSAVDAENSFGAKIRTVYTCTVTHTGGDNWRLDDLKAVE